MQEHTDHDFGICMAVSYGKMEGNNVYPLVEWIEMKALFGVTEVNFYNATVTACPLTTRFRPLHVSGCFANDARAAGLDLQP